VSKSNVVQVLQAAHILPYRGEDTNHITNGIILRSDIHDLFDLNLICIDDSYKIIVSPLLKETEYEKYHNQKIHLPVKQEDNPCLEALRLRPIVYRE
jgi:5-methylcytosine-specific restriction protein A